MYELKKKLERYLRVNLFGPGPRLMKKEFTGPRSLKVLRNTALGYRTVRSPNAGSVACTATSLTNYH